VNPYRALRTQLLLVLAAGLAACSPLSREEYRTVDAWLLCDECPDSVRAAVKALGDKAVHTLDQALIGPSPGRRANKEAQFRSMYSTLPSPQVSESTYVADLMSNYVAKYQTQAAISLGDIRTPGALAALQRASDSAAARGYRPDVVRVINIVLALASVPRFAGVMTPTTPRFGDTVRVAPGLGLAWNGDESVILHGSPFADSVFVTRWGADSLAFVAVGRLGDYAVSVTGLGPNAVRQVLPLSIIPPGYASHVSATAPVVTNDPFPQTRYILLPNRPGDTTDFFKFTPIAPLTISATVTVSGLTPATLRWYSCAPFSVLTLPGPLTTVSGYVMDEQGRPVENADVRIVALGLSTTTDSAGRFVLNNVPVASPTSVRAAMLGFRPSETPVQVAADSVGLGVVRSTLTEGTAVNRQASTLTIPGGSCRFLEVRVPYAGGPRVIRLRLRSP
jgi:hypothetical protein